MHWAFWKLIDLTSDSWFVAHHAVKKKISRYLSIMI